MAKQVTPLRAYRKAQGWSLDVLADKLSLSAPQLSRIERNGSHRLATALHIAQVTGLPAADLMKKEVAA